MSQLAYKRILLKISGEVLCGPKEFGFHPSTLLQLANELKELHLMGMQIVLVVGGGNIFR